MAWEIVQKGESVRRHAIPEVAGGRHCQHMRWGDERFFATGVAIGPRGETRGTLLALVDRVVEPRLAAVQTMAARCEGAWLGDVRAYRMPCGGSGARARVSGRQFSRQSSRT